MRGRPVARLRIWRQWTVSEKERVESGDEVLTYQRVRRVYELPSLCARREPVR